MYKELIVYISKNETNNSKTNKSKGTNKIFIKIRLVK